MLLQLATGSGKTVIFLTVIKGAYERGKRCVMVVRGRSLVDQASRRLTQMGLDHGVYMANHKLFAPEKMVQIASIDTINSRDEAPLADLLVIDECHYATSDSFKKMLEYYPDAFWLSVTATPWVKKGLLHLVTDASCVVYPISIRELIQAGHLVDGEYWSPAKIPFDRSKISVSSTGDFNEKEALLQFEKQHVYGDVIENFKNKCINQPTFVFAINKSHAITLEAKLKNNGISCVTITDKTPLQKRIDLIKELEAGEINAIVSVGTMTTGVDVPSLKNIVVCRPTLSRNLHVQMLGRGTRPFEGKSKFYIYDHVGNCLKHGPISEEEKVDLSKVYTKSKTPKAAPMKTCPECFMVNYASVRICGDCGTPFAIADAGKEVKTDMIKLDMDDLTIRMRLFCDGFLKYMWASGRKKSGLIYYKLIEKFGETAMAKPEYKKISWEYKTKYEKWLDGRTSAPGTFNSNNIGFESEY